MLTHALALVAFTVGCGALGSLGFRWAGGLLSQWVKHDLGDFVVRQLWGLTATLPLIPLAISSTLPVAATVLLMVFCSVGTGLMRGAGWGNSLSLGFSEVGKSSHDTPREMFVMAYHLAAMIAVPFVVAFVLGAHDFMHAGVCAAMLIGSVGLSVQGYYEAWEWGGIAIPALGCSRNDPPPTGELTVGFVTAFSLALYSF